MGKLQTVAWSFTIFQGQNFISPLKTKGAGDMDK